VEPLPTARRSAACPKRLYVPPGITPEQLADVTLPLVLTEGEKKALALWRLAWDGTDSPRFVPVATAGVWNWRGVTGKASTARGERIDVKGPIADLSRISWEQREVFILFDANVTSNEQVEWARTGIARELTKRKATVKFINLPDDCGVNGVDDLLAIWGAAKVLELFNSPTAAAQLQVVPTPQFEPRPTGLYRTVQRGERLSQTQLTNYCALVKTNICLDDGLELKREFEIQADLLGSSFRFTLPASKFAAMDWPIEQMGSGAITFPNQREYARTAIQSLSATAEHLCVYTHTGWRRVDGEWIYLHAAGGLGRTGTVDGVHVRLVEAMSRYSLQLPKVDDVVAAVRASLQLLELAPASVSFPLLAATYRSVFGGSDFSIHLVGETGAFKSELAALQQQHFGAAMSRKHLPASWSSTANAIEGLAFHAKDALIVVDDFAPQGSAADVSRYHAAADRVFRAAGNGAGRGRMDSTAKLREPKPPRGLILSTGEDIPRGHSVRARLLILEVEKGAISLDQLSACQRDAGVGRYAEAQGAFIQWIAPRYEDLQAALAQRVTDLRLEAAKVRGHARTPEMIANLQAGFEFYLDFAVACGAIELNNQKRLTDRCWDALLKAGSAQAKHQETTEPTERYLSLLRGCIASGRAYLASNAGETPASSPESCGWRRDGHSNWMPSGDCVGWVVEDDIYVEPSTAYRVVQQIAQSVGDALPVSEQTLKKRLKERGLLASVDTKRGTLTVRRVLSGSRKDVLHFWKSNILPEGFEGPSSADDAGAGEPEMSGFNVG
jgi:hypothetical protein